VVKAEVGSMSQKHK